MARGYFAAAVDGEAGHLVVAWADQLARLDLGMPATLVGGAGHPAVAIIQAAAHIAYRCDAGGHKQTVGQLRGHQQAADRKVSIV